MKESSHLIKGKRDTKKEKEEEEKAMGTGQQRLKKSCNLHFFSPSLTHCSALASLCSHTTTLGILTKLHEVLKRNGRWCEVAPASKDLRRTGASRQKFVQETTWPS